MPNADRKIIVIPIANNGFPGRDLIPVPSKPGFEEPAVVISTEKGSRVRALEIVSNWKELHCNLTLSQIAIFTNLVRAVTVRLEHADRRNEYQDVLEKIDCRLNGILARYPGSGFDFETDPDKDVFRVCNIGRVPVTDEGFDFIKSVYDLLEGRRDELEAEKKRKEDEIKALLNGPMLPGNVFEVEIRYTPNKNYRTGNYIVWAENEAAAEQKALVTFHKHFPVVRAKNYPFKVKIKTPGRGSWQWNFYFRNGGKCE